MESVTKIWEAALANTLVGGVFFVIFFYLFFRHLLFVLMLMDLITGWLRKFNWFPKEGKRRKTIIHWVIAWGLFWGCLEVGILMGWVESILE